VGKHEVEQVVIQQPAGHGADYGDVEANRGCRDAVSGPRRAQGSYARRKMGDERRQKRQQPDDAHVLSDQEVDVRHAQIGVHIGGARKAHAKPGIA